MQKITPFLWFDKQAEEAARFYTSVFKNSRINSVSRYPEGSPYPAGTVMTVEFEIEGQQFIGLNGGPNFPFTWAVSFTVNCADQAEVDYFWDKLSAGGEESQCGWLKDRYGLSWQITPTVLPRLVQHPDPAKAQRAMAAMLTMKKIDIAALEQAVRD